MRSIQAIHAAYFFIAINVLIFINQEALQLEYKRFNIANGSFPNMLYSMFYHDDWLHLLSNVISLYTFSKGLHLHTHNPVWRRVSTFLIIYLGSGFVGLYGVKVMDSHYDSLWKSRVRNIKKSMECSSWICSYTVNQLSTPAANAFSLFFHGSEFAAMQINKLAHRVGASGCISGLIGARIYTACFSTSHEPLEAYTIVWLFAFVFTELTSASYSLETLYRQFFVEKDYVDHIAHLAGCMCGFIVAAAVDWYGRTTRRGRRLDD